VFAAPKVMAMTRMRTHPPRRASNALFSARRALVTAAIDLIIQDTG